MLLFPTCLGGGHEVCLNLRSNPSPNLPSPSGSSAMRRKRKRIARYRSQGKGQWRMIAIRSLRSLSGVGLLAAALIVFATSRAQTDLFISSDTHGTVLQYDEKTGD